MSGKCLIIIDITFLTYFQFLKWEKFDTVTEDRNGKVTDLKHTNSKLYGMTGSMDQEIYRII